MGTGAQLGKKTLFERETLPGSGVYVTIAEVKSIAGPKMSRGKVDATNMDSVGDAIENIPGLVESGEVDLGLNFRPDHASQGGASGLKADFDAGTVRGWRVRWPQFANTPTMTFQGFVMGYEVTSAAKDLITSAVKICTTGVVSTTNFA